MKMLGLLVSDTTSDSEGQVLVQYCYESCVISVLARQTDGSTDPNYNEGLAYIAAEPDT